MCGIFGIISKKKIDFSDLKFLAMHARQRGKDSSGYLEIKNNDFYINRFNYDLKYSIKKIDKNNQTFIGHARLVTNSMVDNQPIYKNDIALFHNGIITNSENLFRKYNLNKNFSIDTEIIIELFNFFFFKNKNFDKTLDEIFSNIIGTASCAMYLFSLGKLILFSNNGSLYTGQKNEDIYFSSEKFPLKILNCQNIFKVNKYIILDVPSCHKRVSIKEDNIIKNDLVPVINNSYKFSKKINYKIEDYLTIKKCTKCILPKNFPFIHFDEKGICNYCKNYKKNFNFSKKEKKEEFIEILKKYKSKNGDIKCIFPLSGGRDSCYGLHIAVNELGIKPLTFTYDWGLVTDLARRNISKMCSKLNVENIIYADNIEKKRNYIKKNILAWLEKPTLGMVNIFTAGDKHFYRFLEKIKLQTEIDLNIWSYNPMETTHFKHGFLGIPPKFDNANTYLSGYGSQINYQMKRILEFLKNYRYINSSLFDTYHGEFYRSILKKKDYFYIFKYFEWEELEVHNTLLNNYNWEVSPDSKSTWRVGDGAASFYNFIYYLFCGFTEFNTFRSNQIREGQITRQEALSHIEKDNKPRFTSIKWFLDVIGLDFNLVIDRIYNAKDKKFKL